MAQSKKIVAVTVVAILIIAGAAFAIFKMNDNKEYVPGELIDYYGNTFTLDAEVERCVVESGAPLRFLTYMGEDAAKTVVGTNSSYSYGTGTTQYSYVHDFSNVATLGTLTSSAESIIALEPDIVFIGCSKSSLNDAQTTLISVLREVGIPTCVIGYLDDVTTDDYKDQVRLMGKIFNKSDVAEKLISETDKVLADLEKRMASVSAKGVYVGGVAFAGTKDFLWSNVTYGGFLYLGDKVSNVAKSIDPSATYQVSTDWEHIYNVMDRIDAAFVDLAGYNLTKAQWTDDKTKFTEIDAIESSDFYYILSQTSSGTCHDNTIISAYIVGKILYPAAFSDVDIGDIAKSVYSMFYCGDDSAGNKVYNGICNYVSGITGTKDLYGTISW